VLGYLSPEIEWNLIAVGEQWRRSLEVIWRKRSPRPERLSRH
jgi:hypothetical protein